MIIFEKNGAVFLFNFHHTNSIPNYKFRVPEKGKYRVVLNSDSKQFGGHGRIDEDVVFETFEEDGNVMLQVYLPNRTAFVLTR